MYTIMERTGDYPFDLFKNLTEHFSTINYNSSFENGILNVITEDGKIIYYMKVPGSEKEDISIDLDNNKLLINIKENESLKDSGIFTTKVEIEKEIDPIYSLDEIEPELKNGILFITIKRKKETQKKSINIK